MTIPAAFSDDITLVPFAPEHLEGAHRLSQIAQWPHRVEDWALNLTVSKGVVALLNGEVVGTAICSILGDVATFNMIIVDERLRGRGLGRKLMAELFALAEDRELRLVATAEGLPLYEKLGFQVTGEIVQHQGIVQSAADQKNVTLQNVDQKNVEQVAVEQVASTELATEIEAFAEQDEAATGMRRLDLLREIVGQTPQDTAFFKTQGGYALLRRFGRGLVLGPVLASEAAVAKSLIAAAASHAQGRFLRLDMPKELGLSDYAESLGLSYAGGGTVMVAHPKSCQSKSTQADAAAIEMKTYALVSQALG